MGKNILDPCPQYVINLAFRGLQNFQQSSLLLNIEEKYPRPSVWDKWQLHTADLQASKQGKQCCDYALKAVPRLYKMLLQTRIISQGSI